MIASASFRSLGTTATVVVTDARALEEARRILAGELDRFDEACSRFRTDSELSRANANAGHTVEIGPLLARATEVAIAAARATRGLVTPTVGPALAAAGYDRTFELVRQRRTWTVRATAPSTDAWQEIRLDLAQGTLRVPRGAELDLGATAKALAADCASATIAGRVGGGALVSLGGDIAVAGDPPRGGWVVRIADDHEAPLDSAGPSVVIGTGGLATSSTTVRRWTTDHGEAHHIVDPRTGRPAATRWRTVSVYAASCVDANVAALAALLSGSDAPARLDERGLHGRFVGDDGTVSYAGGWPAGAEAA
ncbi:MAG TPA: FAD:protein FMN transferase [Gaiellaceae bacterium]|nr:FAD:protein FMN transferase [Gaiellaceae bacterium]